MEVPTVCFAISSCTVCLKVLLSVLLLPRSNCSFRPWFLMLLWHSSRAQHLFQNVHPIKVPLISLSLVQFFHRLCLTICPLWPLPLGYAVPALQIIHLWAAANFFQDPSLLCVHFCGCQRLSTATFQFPYRSFSAPKSSTAASSLEASWCSN
jgi:hypothetical protein